MRYSILFFTLLVVITGCQMGQEKNDKLPFLGQHEINGRDTVYHQIRDFSFMNQDSTTITNTTFAGKIYVTDFFFISCPTICPKVKKQMLRIYEKFKDEDRLKLLSHTIDTKHDTIPRLKFYAENLGVSADRWHFVTGNKDDIFDIAEDYMSIVVEDASAPGGFDHSGWLILVDEERHVRSYCNGTKEEDVTKFMEDISKLLSEGAVSE